MMSPTTKNYDYMASLHEELNRLRDYTLDFSRAPRTVRLSILQVLTWLLVADYVETQEPSLGVWLNPWLFKNIGSRQKSCRFLRSALPVFFCSEETTCFVLFSRWQRPEPPSKGAEEGRAYATEALELPGIGSPSRAKIQVCRAKK